MPVVPAQVEIARPAVRVSGIFTAIILAAVVAALYFGREVLLPLALAILLSFVLAPLLEIAPDCVIPGLGAARDWLARCLDQPVKRIAA